MFFNQARAEDAKPSDLAPTATQTANVPAAPPEFVLKFDQNDIATLNQCVGELPFKIAQPFVTKMNVQMAPQLKPKGN